MGAAFLESMLKYTADQIKLHKSEETSSTFFDAAIFCTNVTYANGCFKGGVSLYTILLFILDHPSGVIDLTSRSIATADTDPVEVQSELAAAWSSLIPEFPTNNVHVLPSIEHVVRVVRGIGSEGEEGVDVFVTGSLHLVGGVIEVAGLSGVAL